MATVILMLDADYQQTHGLSTFEFQGSDSLGGALFIFTANDPETTSPELQRYFSTTVTDDSVATQLVEELIALPEVEASWIKPSEGPP